MKTEPFGIDGMGRPITRITLENKNGMKAVLSDKGAVLVSLLVPDRDGRPTDVVLGYENIEGYDKNGCCFGATIGRNGNRIANARFTLNGKEYQMHHTPTYKHNCHSTPDTFFRRVWQFATEKEAGTEKIRFTLFSPDGDQGFPGNMEVEVVYTLTDENELRIDYFGLSDQDTVMNMTNHSYFNLNGHDAGDVLAHRVKLYSDSITEVDGELIPTGKLLPVEGTPFDFREWKEIGADIRADDVILQYGHGYDHNFVVNGGEKTAEATLCAECIGDRSGIRLKVYTDLPGIQMYTANGLKMSGGKNGAEYGSNSGVCFETQYAPNAINIPSFCQPVIRAGEKSHSRTVFAFEA